MKNKSFDTYAGSWNMALKKYKLKKLLEIKNGKDHKALLNGKYPVYGSGGVIRYVNEYLYNKPSILLPRKGSLTNIQYVDVPFWTVDTTYYTEVNTKLVVPYYLYRYLNLLNLESLDSGTGVPSMTFDSYYNIVVEIPHLPIQERIAKVLTDIDSKISLNKTINKELEVMAKGLYDYWFVQFDFPNEDGKPYKSSGGKMKFNSILKRDIPEGWEVKSINDFCKNYRGVSYDKSDLLTGPEEGVLVLRGNNIDGNTLVYDDNVAYVPPSFVEPEQKIKKHDIIMTMSSGSKEHVGKCTMFQSDSEHTYGAFMTKFTPDPECPFFAYRSMLSDFFKAKIKYICGGTGINNLTNQTFDEILFPFPSKDVLKAFEKMLSPIYDKVGKTMMKY